MQIFVVNLEKDQGRRAHMVGQLRAVNLRFEWLRAIRGAGLSVSELSKHYDDAKAKWNRARSLTPSEIGCALSHIKAYRAIVQRDLPRALILEDDVDIPRHLPQMLEWLEGLLPASEPLVCLLSEASVFEDAYVKPLPDAGSVMNVFQSGHYTSSYIVTRTAAEILANELYPVGDVADCWNRLRRFKVVDIRAVVPAAVRQIQNQFGSSTTEEIRAQLRPGSMAQLLYKARRARNLLWEGAAVALHRASPALLRKPSKKIRGEEPLPD